MAGSIDAWSTTAASNATADSTINWAENQAPSTVNDSARALMATLAGFYKDNNSSLTTGGSAVTQTVTLNNTPAALATGLRFHAKSGFTNTGSCWMTVTPQGAAAFASKAIKIFTEAGEADPGAGQIVANGHYAFEYDAAANAAAGAWMLLNPSITAGVALLAGGSISGTSTFDLVLTSYSAYRNLVLHVVNYRPGTDNVSLQMRFSTDGGATFDAGASDYRFSRSQIDETPAQTLGGSAGATSITMAGAISNSANGGLNMEIKLFNPRSTAFRNKIFWEGGYINTSGVNIMVSGSGHRAAAQDTDAIRLLPSAGTTMSLDYSLYGYR